MATGEGDMRRKHILGMLDRDKQIIVNFTTNLLKKRFMIPLKDWTKVLYVL